MDLYTTSLTLPRPTLRGIRAANSPLPLNVNLPSSGTLASIPLPNIDASSNAALISAQTERDWEVVQKMCLDITSREGCLVTVSRELDMSNPEADPSTAATVWNFHLSGGYQSVMAARGAVLRETPRDNHVSLKVPRTDVLESPLGKVSPLKAEVQRRLDDIALESRAHIAVINNDIVNGVAVLATADGQSAQPSHAPSQDPQTTAAESAGIDSVTTGPAGVNADAAVKDVSPSKSQANATTAPSAGQMSYGLETERMCEIVVTGSVECVEVAKVRVLVMLDELVSLRTTWLFTMLISCRMVFMPSAARLITNYTRSLPHGNELSYNRFKKRQRPTSTTLLRSLAFSIHPNLVLSRVSDIGI